MSESTTEQTVSPNRANKTMGVVTLAMINVAAVLSLRNFPTMAAEGWGMIFWYVLFTLFFLIPTALVAAELASTWPRSGGIYSWVKEAYPKKGSFITIWCSWVNNIVWFPTVVSFITVTIAYAILEPLWGSQNTAFMALIMLGAMWALTFFNFTGMKNSSKLSTLGATFGSLIPIGILVILGFWWLADGNVNNMGPLTGGALIPSMDTSMLTFAASLVLMFAGMEMAGYHARETKNPQRDYPKAMFLAAAIICIVSIIGTWGVGVIVDPSFWSTDAGLNGGVVEAFNQAFIAFGIDWLITPIALMVAVGVLAQLSTWMMGPAKGLAPAAFEGELPPIFRKENKHGAPVGVLVIQASVSSLFVVMYLVMVAIDMNGYWVLTAITTLINIIMYAFMFLAFIKLRTTQADKKRPYKLPGGNIGKWLIGGIALGTLAFGFVVGLFPSEEGWSMAKTIGYVVFMFIMVIVVAVLPPYIIDKWLKKDSWMPTKEEYDAYMQHEHEDDTPADADATAKAST